MEYLTKIKNDLYDKFKICTSREVRLYNIAKILLATGVVFKMLLFYNLTGVKSNFLFVWAISCTFVYLLFSKIENKLIAGVIYFFISLMMFADVVYYSFFSKYLSLQIASMFSVISNIGANIKETLRPIFFLIPLDSVLILVLLIIYRIIYRNSRK